jgi:hypothetical protein
MQTIPQTRAPIPYIDNPYNYMLNLFGVVAPYSQQFIQPPNAKELADDLDAFWKHTQENPPEVMKADGFTGFVPFDWGKRGVEKGRFHPLLGASTVEAMPLPPEPPIPYFQRLSAVDLATRIAMIEQYVETAHSVGKIKQIMPYIDFQTQLFGRHNEPPAKAADAWGFWEFYDAWNEYAGPLGPYGLGPKPPPPTTWLAQWEDQSLKKLSLPDQFTDLTGLSFAYDPYKPPPPNQPNYPPYGDAYRYTVCIATQGWAMWWKQVVQWAARVGYDGVYVDNAGFAACWNSECQEAYRNWLQENFTAEEIRRYFTTCKPQSLLTDSSLEYQWYQEHPAQSHNWVTPNWSHYGALTSPIFPDTEAYVGRYCCGIEPNGGGTAVLSHITTPHVGDPNALPTNADLLLSFFYKTDGVVQATLKMTWENLPTAPLESEQVLALVDDWTQVVIALKSPVQVADLLLVFEVTGTGRIWFDEFWLGTGTELPELDITLHRPNIDPPDPVRAWAAQTFWSSLADERLGYLREQGRQVNPEFKLFTNGFHAVDADYFLSEGRAISDEVYRIDQGFPPGTYHPYAPPLQIMGNHVRPKQITEPLVVTNIFDYKYVHSRRVRGFFGYHIPLWFSATMEDKNLSSDENIEHLKKYAHNTDSALLNLAEAAAFGGGAACDAARLIAEYYLYKDGAHAAAILAVEKNFWDFIGRHKHRYSGYHTHADVGIVYHDLSDKRSPDFVNNSPANAVDPPYSSTYPAVHLLMDLAKGLGSRGVLWDLLTENRCNEENFAGLRALIYQDIARISEAEVHAVLEFLGEGGLVIAAGTVGDDDEWFRMRLLNPGAAWPPVGKAPKDYKGTRDHPDAFQQPAGLGKLIYQPDPFTVDQVIAAIEDHLQRTVQILGNVSDEALAQLRVNAWVRDEGGGTVTLHVLNYNVPLGVDNGGQVQSLPNVQVSMPVPVQMKVNVVRLYSPETNSPPPVVPFPTTMFQLENGLVKFEIPGLGIYTLAVIE